MNIVERKRLKMTEKLFALDIGTRSIVGIILEQIGEQFHVVDIYSKEHKERAMVDGQIHNVILVAQLIQEIKEELEKKHGQLTKVNVAAAGRSLKTEQAKVNVSIKNRPIFTEEDVHRLELQAVQQAGQQLLEHNGDKLGLHFYCVGYSVLFYRLDGEEIGSLVDQQGDTAEIEVIATFLPRVVVESLLAALKRAGLEMEALTLEPIAAINVLIPSTMRRLNVALVDIGAGTSDIAITDQGTVVAYGMVPTAGDEITEALSDHYLLDFPVADSIKRQLQTEEQVLVKDILGFDQYVTSQEVIASIYPAIEQLAQSIGKEILRLNNNQTPKAVMLVGGGSLTPNITQELSKFLQLPENRVAVRRIDAIQNLTREDHIPATPELVTPIGIAIAAKKSPVQYMSVTVNNQVIRLFEVKEMTVMDALLGANIRAKQLYGKPGAALSITVNNQSIFIPGEHGTPSTILVNGQNATTKTPIKSGDSIEIVLGQDGKMAEAKVKDIVDDALSKSIYVNGDLHKLEPRIYVNDNEANLEQALNDRDQVKIDMFDTIEKALHRINMQHLLKQLEPYKVSINGQDFVLPQFSVQLYNNGKVCKPNYPLNDGDHIEFKTEQQATLENILNSMDLTFKNSITVTFQNEQLVLTNDIIDVFVNGVTKTLNEIVPNGAKIEISQVNQSQWIFQDVFRYSNWQIPQNFKGQFKILRNGQMARFDTPIFNGDILAIELIEQPFPIN